MKKTRALQVTILVVKLKISSCSVTWEKKGKINKLKPYILWIKLTKIWRGCPWTPNKLWFKI
jgi:hypothetical protein